MTGNSGSLSEDTGQGLATPPAHKEIGRVCANVCMGVCMVVFVCMGVCMGVYIASF